MGQPNKDFRDLGVDGRLVDALARQGITRPFPIQELTLPLALRSADVIGQARTGTGKTLAFGLPLLQRIDSARRQTQALVVVPTRELCVQVTGDLELGSHLGVTVASVYGGVDYEPQIRALTHGVHVVVGTPGRLLDHLGRGNLDLAGVTTLVLDEADEMLDMGFLPDVERLIEACAGDRHTMLFSATMPTAVVKLARRYMDRPTFMRADVEEHQVAPTVEQHFFHVHRMDKPRVLARILQTPGRGGAYVFVRTKSMADRLVVELDQLGVGAVAVHGDLRQATRERNMDRFRGTQVDVLVATEVAARGLDVEGVTHVVNYDCPDDEKMYLHRIGRTARAGNAGVAITFAQFNEVDRLNVIRKALGATDRRVDEVFSTSPLLRQLFDLPPDAPWTRRGAGNGHQSHADSRRPAVDGRRHADDDRRRHADDHRRRSSGRGRDADGDAAPSRRSGERGRVRTRTRPHEAGRSAAAAADAVAGGERERSPAHRGTSARRDEPARSRRGGRGQREHRTDDGGGHQRERDAALPHTPPTARRGKEARGGGTPQRARRVDVEHLP